MKSTVKEITYSRRVNLGNYEHQDTSATVVPAEGQDPFECLAEVQALVNGEKIEKQEAATETPKKAKKSKAPEEKVQEPVVEKDPEPEVSEPVAEEKEEVKETPKKKLKVKLTPYDRSNQLHKTFFGEILDSKFPNWKVDKDLKAKAVKASSDLSGQDMLDAEGIIVPEFKEKVYKAMQ